MDKRLLHVFRVADTDFFPSFLGMQSDRFVSKDREANHSFVADNLYAVFAGRIMGYEAPGTTTHQSVVKLETGA